MDTATVATDERAMEADDWGEAAAAPSTAGDGPLSEVEAAVAADLAGAVGRARSAGRATGDVGAPRVGPLGRAWEGEISDPVARATWAAVLQLDEGLQHEFLERLGSRLAVPEVRVGDESVRLARLVSGVRAAERLVRAENELLAAEKAAATDTAGGGSDGRKRRRRALSEAEYERLRRANPDRGWPPAGSLRRWVSGTWNDVLRRARLPTVPGGDVVRVVRSSAFTWPEVRDAVQLFLEWRAGRGADSGAACGIGDYRAWLRRPDVVGLPGRRPASQSPFDAFGGFRRVLQFVAAGGDLERPPDSSAEPPVTAVSFMARSGYQLPDEALLAAVQAVAERLGVPPTAAAYREERAAVLRQMRDQAPAALSEDGDGSAAALDVPPLPSYGTIVNRFGSWKYVLSRAGLRPEDEVEVNVSSGRAVSLRPPNELPMADVLAGLREAYAELGEPFLMSAYDAWAKRNKRSPTTGRRTATYSAIYTRFRGARGASAWKAACAAAGVPR